MAWDALQYRLIYNFRKKNRLCVKCGKFPPDNGVVKCRACRSKSNTLQRERNARLHLKKIDKLIERDLIPAHEAADILGISIGYLYKLRKTGVVNSKALAPEIRSLTYWYDESEIRKVAKLKSNNIKRSRDKKGRFKKENTNFLSCLSISNKLNK